MKENLLVKSFVAAHSAAAPEINAPIGNARRNPPFIPWKYVHPDAPFEKTGSPKPPMIKYKITDVNPTLNPNSKEKNTTNRDCNVLLTPSTASKEIFPSIDIAIKARIMKTASSNRRFPVIDNCDLYMLFLFSL